MIKTCSSKPGRCTHDTEKYSVLSIVGGFIILGYLKNKRCLLVNISSCQKVTLLRGYNLKAAIEAGHQTPFQTVGFHNPWLFLADSIMAWIHFLQSHQNECIGNQDGMRNPHTPSASSSHIYLMGLKFLIIDWMCPPYCPIYNCT